MKTPPLSSSEKSSSAAMEEDRPESRADSCYYPGCRKDANCECEMCLASMNATLDLMPISIQKSSLTKLSASRPRVERTPVSFDPSLLSTPKSTARHQPLISPILKSTARMNLKLQENMEDSEEIEKEREDLGFVIGGKLGTAIVVLILILSAGFGFSMLDSGVFRPVVSAGVVRRIGERCRAVGDLNRKLSLLQRELQGYVGDVKVSNCSYANSKWKIHQDGMLLISQCTLYKTAMEEVSIWGWPLQTAGLLSTGFSSRSFTILSGRVTEWAEGNVGYAIRKANSSWSQRSWGASAVQLDPNTWILEYRRSMLMEEKSSLFGAVMELLRFRMCSVVKKMKEELWVVSGLATQFSELKPMIPT